MRLYEFSKKYDIAISDIAAVLKERGIHKVLPEKELSPQLLDFLARKFRVQLQDNAVKERKLPAAGKSFSPRKISVGELSDELGCLASDIIVLLFKQGIVANKNQFIEADAAQYVAQELGATIKKSQEVETALMEKQDICEDMLESEEKRLPVVVIVGHVDHGKTTLLDYLRKSRVAAREAGGITQHLGAYEVETAQGNIVFLDTPGHEAFSRMRERGVSVADVVVLIVAADDGVMPQTVESIKAAQELKAPLVVAVSKIDKADPSRIDVVKRQLSEYGVLCDEWGGDTPVVGISAKEGQGVDDLLDLIRLQADMVDLVTSSSVTAQGYVLESRMKKGRGAVATVLLDRGTLQVGDFFVCGKTFGKVSSLVNSHKKMLRKVGASLPVQVAGFDQLPEPGDILRVATQAEVKQHKIDILSNKKEVRIDNVAGDAISIIVKAGTLSSLEAVITSLEKINIPRAKQLKIIDSGVGDITEGNIDFAVNSGAQIFALDVKVDKNVSSRVAKKASIQLYTIIYKLIDDVFDIVKSTKEPEYIIEEIGAGAVKAVFQIKSLGTIAGAAVTQGSFKKSAYMSVFRNKEKITEGKITSLQKERNATNQVFAGTDCAFSLDSDFSDWQIGDELVCFTREIKPE